MCWNESVSLNTFVFGMFSILFVLYNNAYTQYKIKGINIYTIGFFLSVIFVQFFEAFIWRNFNNRFWNQFFTFMVGVCLHFEPIFLMLMMSPEYNYLRNVFLGFYIGIFTPISIFFLRKGYPISILSQKKHLTVLFFDYTAFWPLWLLCFFVPMFFMPFHIGKILGLLTFSVAMYNWFVDGSIGSMWCWISNMLFFALLFTILFYLPLQSEH